jgi:hypothetical protein
MQGVGEEPAPERTVIAAKYIRLIGTEPIRFVVIVSRNESSEAIAMKKIILAAMATFMLGSAALASPAEARCWWNGYAVQCWHPDAWWWHHHYWHHHPYAWRHGRAWHGYYAWR